MSKGTLLFDLPQETDEFWLSSNAHEIATAVQEHISTLRNIIKYNADEHDNSAIAAYEHARSMLIDELSDRGLLRALDF